MAEPRRIIELDGLRGIACLAVVCAHYFGEVDHGFRWFALGWAGVDLFFLSIGLSDRRHPHRQSRQQVLFFDLLYPALLPYLSHLLRHGHGRPHSPLFAIGPPMGRSPFAGPRLSDLFAKFHPRDLWYRGQQMAAANVGRCASKNKFYLLLTRCHPVLDAATVPAAGPDWPYRERATISIGPFDCFQEPSPNPRLGFPWACWDLLFLGVLGAYVCRSRDISKDPTASNRRLLEIIIVVSIAANPILLLLDKYLQLLSFDVIGPLLIGIAFTGFILLVVNGSSAAHHYRSKTLRFFGEISYGLYLVHQPVSGLLHGLIPQRAPRYRKSPPARRDSRCIRSVGRDRLVVLGVLRATVGTARTPVELRRGNASDGHRSPGWSLGGRMIRAARRP